jgi:hypothetical protein
MKRIFTMICLFLLSTSVMAKTAWYYDPDRSGEGIVLSELDDGRLVFSYYTHSALKTEAPPVVSPQPPEPLFCDVKNLWFTGLSEYYANGIAIGEVYYDVPVDTYPASVDGNVSNSVVVADFIITSEGDGFVLYMESNHVMCDLTVFGVDHFFTTKLAE